MTRIRMTLAARVGIVLASSVLAAGCGGAGDEAQASEKPNVVRTLTIGAYTTPREVYGRAILPAFAKLWKEKTGEDVKFEESYLGSGAQARAIIGGFEADVAALSLEPDITVLSDGKLITRDWKATPASGMVTQSIVVIAVRPGNPKGLKDWDDLRKPGIQVLTPNPKTSGGAMWNVAALYGAALRGKTSAKAGDSASAERFLRDVMRNVPIMDKGARESMLTFESGIADAAITYENEVLVAQKAGKAMDYVIPSSTILIENPAAVVDVYADKHGTRELADAFVAYLASPEAQKAFLEYGLRPIDGSVVAAVTLPVPNDLFTIKDLGGWPTVKASLFGKGGAFERASAKVVAGK